ncbi:MAG: hypothetical protein ACREXX_17475 [Gammaproteobacteria bacterium]
MGGPIAGIAPARASRNPKDLLLLTTDIQEDILFIEVAPGAQPISERALRDGIL